VSQPDLFVVCKNCGSEVSPYVTECPYCGQRVRKRAPKIDRGSKQAEGRAARTARRPRLPRLRAEEIVGIAPDVRPYATLTLIVLSLLVSVVLASGEVSLLDLGGVVVPIDDEIWRWFTTAFVHDSLGYQFVTLIATGIFGTLLERRFGAVPVVLVFVLAGGAGAALAVTLEVPPVFDDGELYTVLGANGAALGLLFAWLVDDRRAARRGEDRENDLIGVYVVAAALVALSLATVEANLAAAVGGAAAGVVLGLLLTLFTRKSAF
jgi:membrane associated rhomboid family serine protease